MTKVLIITGSVRKGRVADKVLDQVQAELKNYPELEVSIADLNELPMPFVNSELIPSNEDFKPTDENVKKFSKLVSETDVALILSPEYNHSIPAVLKNAIDWLFKEWKGKKIAFIGYGWVGGARSIKHLHDVFGNLRTEFVMPEANLRFTKEIDMDGTFLSDEGKAAIDKVLAAL